jgi:hypothetical protein
MRFPSRSMSDWGEDDAWDSASDEESAIPEPPRRKLSSTSSSGSRPVPKHTRTSSSSTLESSFTHLSGPNPSSYPPKTYDSQSTKNGWTIVRKSNRSSVDESAVKKLTESADVDVECDMVLGDSVPDVTGHVTDAKLRQGHGSIRDDVDEILNGIL